jgi:hypothetical protein
MLFPDIDTYHALVCPVPDPYFKDESLVSAVLKSPLGPNVASHFIDTNFDFLGEINSLGKALIAVPKFITGTLPLKLSKAIQGGHDDAADSLEEQLRYLLSFPPWLVGTLSEATFEFIGSAVIDVPIHLLKKLAAFAVSVASTEISSADRPASLTKDKKNQVLPYAKMLRATQSNHAYKLENESTIKAATQAQIPTCILAKRSDKDTDDYGTKLALRMDDTTNDGVLLLRSGSWSALRVGVFQHDGKIILCFDGTAASRPGTLKSDMASLSGIYDSAYREGKKLVKAFVEQYGANNVVVTGHSLGAAIGAYAAMTNSKKYAQIKGVFFNGLGLHPSLYQKLGDRMQFASNMTNVNTLGDWLTQYQPLSPPRLNYTIPDSEGSGHTLKAVVCALEKR